MPERSDNPVATLLADMVRYTSHGNLWHNLAEAASELTKASFGYAPIPAMACDWQRCHEVPPPRIITPRCALMHIAGSGADFADHLAPRARRKVEREWDTVSLEKPLPTAKAVIEAADVSLRRLHARASVLTDDQLTERSRMWGSRIDAPRLLLLIDRALLHISWHLGQVALLTGMCKVHRKTEIARPEGPPVRLPRCPGTRDWSDCHVADRPQACLRLLDAAYRETPWHALRRTCQSLTQAEMNWRPFPSTRLHYVCVRDIALHVAACKVVYADYAFGDATLDWGDIGSVLGVDFDPGSGPRKLLSFMDRAQEYLLDHVARATDAVLDRKNPMHHGVPHTGWQTAASMAQHDAWHAGQISILRETYAEFVRG